MPSFVYSLQMVFVNVENYNIHIEYCILKLREDLQMMTCDVDYDGTMQPFNF